MKFYKLIEIDEEEYCEKTQDLFFDNCAQTVIRGDSVNPDDKNIYIATDLTEDEIRIDLETIIGEDCYPEYDEDDEEWEDE